MNRHAVRQVNNEDEIGKVASESELPPMDATTERIFYEADGDRRQAYDSIRYQYSGSEYSELIYRVTQKFVAVEEAAAARIYTEAASDRDRAFQLLRGVTELKDTYGVEKILRQKFQAADNERADQIAERCHREANGDRSLAYRLVRIYAGDGDAKFNYLADTVSNRVMAMFITDTINEIGDSHPFNGQRKIFRRIGHEGQYFYDVGIEAGGQLINPKNYPEDQLRVVLRRDAAVEIEKRKEATARAVATRARRQDKLIHEIANGINAGKRYGPRANCLRCKKPLTDPVSIDRGIGPECWDHILTLIEHTKDREAQAVE